ncbi:MAG: chemotaxis protein CheW [Vulcanimicrobiaceae bacterium]|jgi:purine-binding chemotaxis protein CheW
MTTTADMLQVVVFALQDNEFGIDIAQVREIDRLVPITRVPRVPAHVEGIINLRGQLVPVVDLRTRLGMPHSVPTKLARIIVADIDTRSIGMIVDEVREVVRIPVEQISKSEGVLEGLANEFIGALGRVDERLIILLDVEKLLGPEAPNALTDKGNM